MFEIFKINIRLKIEIFKIFELIFTFFISVLNWRCVVSIVLAKAVFNEKDGGFGNS